MCDDLAHGGRRCPGCRSGGRKDPALRRARRAAEKVRRAWEAGHDDATAMFRPRGNRPGRPAATRYGTIVASTETGRVVAWSDGVFWSPDGEVIAGLAGADAQSPSGALARMRSVLEGLGEAEITLGGDLSYEASPVRDLSTATAIEDSDAAKLPATPVTAHDATSEPDEYPDGSRWVTVAAGLVARTAKPYAQRLRALGWQHVLVDSTDLHGAAGTWDVRVLVPAGGDEDFPPVPAPADLKEEARLELEAEAAHERRRIDRVVGTNEASSHRAWLVEQLEAARSGQLAHLDLPGLPADPAYWQELVEYYDARFRAAGPVLDLSTATAIEDRDAAKRPTVTLTAYDGGSAEAANAYADQLTAAGWSAWAHPVTEDRPLGRRNSWVVTVTVPEGTTAAELPARQKVPRRTEEEVISAEVSERYDLLVSGAEDASERSENIASLRRALAEAEAGGSRREADVLRGVLALAEDDDRAEDEEEDAWHGQANAALQAHIAATRPAAPSAVWPPAGMTEEQQLYAAHQLVHGERKASRRRLAKEVGDAEWTEATARVERIAGGIMPLDRLEAEVVSAEALAKAGGPRAGYFQALALAARMKVDDIREGAVDSAESRQGTSQTENPPVQA